MRYTLLYIYLFVCSVGAAVYAASPDTWTDTVSLPDVEVSVSRMAKPAALQQMQVSVIDPALLSETQAATPKDISVLVPNIYMPAYGSSMTSGIYIRGLGSRINEPVMGMVVDGIPLLDKNMYDHTMQDVKRIELLRGPQGSLYGRNSPAGVMEIRTIRPLDLTTCSARASLSYATANTVQAMASFYQPFSRKDSDSRYGWGVNARYKRTDGFYTNGFNGQKVDHGQQAGGKLIFDAMPNAEWRLTATVYADWLREGAFPYAQVSTGQIAYNRPSGYERLAMLPSIRAAYEHEGYKLNISAGYQMLRDNMLMDQDYTTADIFTLNQKQTQHNGTLDAFLNAPKPAEWYEWTVGVSAFVKTNHMTAPVTFMREGIEELILGNANRGIQTVFPEDSIEISNSELPVSGDFGLYNAGVAACHQSRFRFGHWHVNAAVRLDYEYTQMDYLSTADVNYRFTLLMSGYEQVHTRIEGTQRNHYFQVLPRLALSYEERQWTVYGYAAKGYKAGGFNPQIFSTVTQNQVMTDLAADMGMHLNIADPRFSDVAITSYRPEKDWTFEIGAHFTPCTGLKIDVDAFHIQCLDQQVTVFPDGKTTGRMMANAARSRMWGAETALHYRWLKSSWQGLIDASYGFTDARFIRFDDGMGDYSGNVVPYAPRHTAHVLVQAACHVNRPWLNAVSLSARTNVIGPVFWNEQNDRSQPPYALLGATLALEWKYLKLELWGKNLTATSYDVFYFRSMGNDFLQKGRPRELGITLILKS